MTVRDQLITAARNDLAWLERRHAKWVDECSGKRGIRSTWWLRYSEREQVPARLRLEQLLEVDVRDPAEATAQL